MFGLPTLLLIGLGLAGAFGVRETVRMLTRPPRRTYAWAVARSRPGDPGELATPRAFRAWSFVSRGSTLPAWDISGDKPTGPTVVITHGWGDSRVTMLGRAEVFAACSARVVLWDLPGHGDAPGRCSLGVREVDDLRSLLTTLGADRPIVLYGFSLGAGVSVVAAGAPEGRAVVGVIAEAPYRLSATPARAVLRQAGMPYRWNLPLALWWIGRRLRGGLHARVFDRSSHAANLTVPLLVLHGDRDEICPEEDGESIAAAAPKGSILKIPGGDHLNLWTNPGTSAAMGEACVSFLQKVTESAKQSHDPEISEREMGS